MACLNMANNMVDIGLYANIWKNVDHLFKLNLKKKSAAGKILWPKQNHMSNYGHFLCILASFETENGIH